jgi:hypothetical protein
MKREKLINDKKGYYLLISTPRCLFSRVKIRTLHDGEPNNLNNQGAEIMFLNQSLQKW